MPKEKKLRRLLNGAYLRKRLIIKIIESNLHFVVFQEVCNIVQRFS
jgi:hypothetical protein